MKLLRKIDDRGRVYIPKDVMDHLNIDRGDYVAIDVIDKKVIIENPNMVNEHGDK